MAEVHAPVARLNDQLEPGVDRFLDRLRPERSFWRLGWGIIDVADGYTPPTERVDPGRSTPTCSALFVRSSARPSAGSPTTGCVLFTIRTYIAPIASVADDPDRLTALAGAVAAMSPRTSAATRTSPISATPVGVACCRRTTGTVTLSTEVALTVPSHGCVSDGDGVEGVGDEVDRAEALVDGRRRVRRDHLVDADFSANWVR